MEQDTGAVQINQAIQRLDQIIQQNASASEEMASTSEELSGQADQLQSMMGTFKLDSNNALPADRRNQQQQPTNRVESTHNYKNNRSDQGKLPAPGRTGGNGDGQKIVSGFADNDELDHQFEHN